MARVLVVYGTTDGHTRTIAAKIAEAACRRGHHAGTADAALGLTPATYDAVIVAAPLRRERQLPQVERFVRGNLAALNDMPTAFCSISLTAALPDPGRQFEARACADVFLRDTGWRPDAVFLAAGALQYSRYGFFTRMMMKRIARKMGGDTDTSRDYVYTDWEKLRRDVDAFLDRLPAGVSAVPAELEPALAD